MPTVSDLVACRSLIVEALPALPELDDDFDGNVAAHEDVIVSARSPSHQCSVDRRVV